MGDKYGECKYCTTKINEEICQECIGEINTPLTNDQIRMLESIPNWSWN